MTLNLFGEEATMPPPKRKDKKRDAWNRRFQRWSNKQSQDETTPNGKCGYGYICDWCKDNSYGNPCVRALNTMLREKRRSIDYETADFESVFYGDLIPHNGEKG